MLHQDLKFGFVPELQALPTGAALGQHTYNGEDAYSAFIPALTPGLAMYASYVDNLGGWSELVRRFGNAGAFLLSITIFGGRARCADVEKGAMHPTDLPHWLDNVAIHDALSPPWVYTSAADMDAVNKEVGSRKIVRFSAHYNGHAHICGPHTCGYPQADWTQWDDHGPQGQNVDRSIGLWVPTTVTPPPPTKLVDPHYERYFAEDFDGLNERKTVMGYDAARKHPLRYHGRLKTLEGDCQTLADRLATLAHQEYPDVPVSTALALRDYHTGFRYQGLIHRAQGQKIV